MIKHIQMKTVCIICLLLLSITLYTQAQTSMNSGSIENNIQGVLHQFTIGEMCQIETSRTQNLIFTQGFNQPCSYHSEEHFSQPSKTIQEKYSYLIYPNPASSILQIKSDSGLLESLTYQLIDFSGKTIMENKYLYKSTQLCSIDIQAVADGTYQLNILQKDQFQTFHILKKSTR